MFYNLRMKIGTILMGKAAEIIECEGFDNVMKGLKIVKLAVRITPPCEELTRFGNELHILTERYSK